MEVLAAVSLVLGGFLLWQGAARRLTILLWLLAGWAIAGWVGGWIDQGARLVSGMIDSVGAKLFGVALTGAVVLACAVWLGFGLVKRFGPEAKAPQALPWVALCFASLLPLLGGQLGAFGNDTLDAVGGQLSQFAASLVG